MKNHKGVIATVVLFAILGGSLVVSALPVPVSEVANQVAGFMVGPISTEFRSFTVTCDTNPDGGTDAVGSTGLSSYQSIMCSNNSSRPVYIGGATTTSENTAIPICNSSACDSTRFDADIRQGLVGCDIGDAGTVTIRCQAGR